MQRQQTGILVHPTIDSTKIKEEMSEKINKECKQLLFWVITVAIFCDLADSVCQNI